MSRDYNYDTGCFRSACALCGTQKAGRELDRVLVAAGPYSTPKTMAKVCRDCLPRVADFLGTELPDIDKKNYRGPSHYRWCLVCGKMVGRNDVYCKNCGREL